jgi:hypothetical protein
MVPLAAGDRLRRFCPCPLHGCCRIRFNYPSKMGWLSMSFDIDIQQILQFGFNIFGSFLPVIYLFVGAAFAIFVIFKIIKNVQGRES